MDGPDYRQRGTAPEGPLTPGEFAAWRARQPGATLAVVAHRDLNRHLLDVHPSRFAKLLAGVGALGVTDLAPMPDQNVALRLVVLADRLYDRQVPLVTSGVPLDRLFDETMLAGGYRKKYRRAVSRLVALARLSPS